MRPLKAAFFALTTVALAVGCRSAIAADLFCPTGYEGVAAEAHHNDAYATSAPEVKVRAGLQADSAVWRRTTRPLILKAVEQAKAKRAASIEDGIENACGTKQQYISQIVPFEERSSGCDYRIVSRPADAEHVWVQAIAFCKYDWNCCRPTTGAMPRSNASSGATSSGTASYSLEGPLNPEPSTTTTTRGSRESGKSSKNQ
jgi:hypothetical protein